MPRVLLSVSFCMTEQVAALLEHELTHCPQSRTYLKALCQRVEAMGAPHILRPPLAAAMVYILGKRVYCILSATLQTEGAANAGWLRLCWGTPSQHMSPSGHDLAF